MVTPILLIGPVFLIGSCALAFNNGMPWYYGILNVILTAAVLASFWGTAVLLHHLIP